MGNNCGCVEKEGENEVVVGQPGKMNKAVDSLPADNLRVSSLEDQKYDTIRESLKSQRDNFQETDKDALKL